MYYNLKLSSIIKWVKLNFFFELAFGGTIVSSEKTFSTKVTAGSNQANASATGGGFEGSLSLGLGVNVSLKALPKYIDLLFKVSNVTVFEQATANFISISLGAAYKF